MSDLISRADAVEVVYRKYPYNAEQNKCDEMVDALKALPSADRPSGKWYQIKNHKIMGEGYLWHCSICDYKVYQDSSKDYPTENYCPNCGARMKGGAE